MWVDDDDPFEWKGVKAEGGRVTSISIIPKDLLDYDFFREHPPDSRFEWSLRLEALPPEIGQLTALTSLNLIWCSQFTTLPSEIGQLTELTSLNLSRCIQFTTLPSEIGQLTTLTKLVLAYLYCEHLMVLPPEIGDLTALTSLDLKDCRRG
ncbi:hypothetical protein CTAYLR_000598 [Chrysophaeum taylorii]|uniref:Disease resistance R13L4/SHOC-2-like LRR domain-containing protein n=1 Tax=Chrysophaeum taylorii TaxID=2483200 RepID=A0AAD7XND8_9STRA|nr:hypothetical protein CTAYLR_000598 [Chrysophaeum taylorii]